VLPSIGTTGRTTGAAFYLIQARTAAALFCWPRRRLRGPRASGKNIAWHRGRISSYVVREIQRDPLCCTPTSTSIQGRHRIHPSHARLPCFLPSCPALRSFEPTRSSSFSLLFQQAVSFPAVQHFYYCTLALRPTRFKLCLTCLPACLLLFLVPRRSHIIPSTTTTTTFAQPHLALFRFPLGNINLISPSRIPPFHHLLEYQYSAQPSTHFEQQNIRES